MTTGIGHPGDHADGLDSPRVVPLTVGSIAPSRQVEGGAAVRGPVRSGARAPRWWVRLATLLLRDADRGEGGRRMRFRLDTALFATAPNSLFSSPLRLRRVLQHLAQPALGRPAAAPGSPVVALR